MNTIRLTGSIIKNKADFARREWLVTNGIGGFAGSSLVGANTRGYHGILIAALKPPLERVLLISKLEETVRTNEKTYFLGTNIYSDTIDPTGYKHLASFSFSFHPTFCFEFAGRVLEKKVYMVYGENTTIVEYHYLDGADRLELSLTPFLTYRDYHAYLEANDWPWLIEKNGIQYKFTAFSGAQPVYLTCQGEYIENRQWHHNLFYSIEEYRGLKSTEDHYLPGLYRVNMKPGDKFAMICSTLDSYHDSNQLEEIYQKQSKRIEELLGKAVHQADETKRLFFAADQFLVYRESSNTATVIAGYPWFTDWGRDSMIALPGLALVRGRFKEAKEILQTFAVYSQHGLIPNRFPDAGEEPEYNTVDATLWFFIAFHEYYQKTNDLDFIKENLELLEKMIDYHINGTLYNIRMETDGLLAHGAEGTQLTWMDAKVNDWVVTPREGKAVEINALWYNVIRIIAEFMQATNNTQKSEKYNRLAEKILASFQRRFWNEQAGYLYDLITDTYNDPAIRPNQIFAISLPFPLLNRHQGARLLNIVKEHLLTPFGLRSLSPKDQAYQSNYGGDQYKRDAAYHQGTVWSWLMGPYLAGLWYVEGKSVKTKEKILNLLNPLMAHLKSDGCIGQISEIFDGDNPYSQRGCYAQAWSIAEILRIKDLIS